MAGWITEIQYFYALTAVKNGLNIDEYKAYWLMNLQLIDVWGVQWSLF